NPDHRATSHLRTPGLGLRSRLRTFNLPPSSFNLGRMPAPLFDSPDSIYDVRTTAPGPAGSLPVEPERLKEMSSGELFGWTQNVGMGWDPKQLLGKQFLILSTHGGLRAPDGTPI